MMEPHTLGSFEALADDAARDAAIARALGWRNVHLHRYSERCAEWVGIPPGQTGNAPIPVPAVFRGGDADAFANWGLLAEVARLLGQRQWCLHSHAPWLPASQWSVFTLATKITDGRTPHRAACLAAVAAGLVPKGDS